MVLGAHPPPAAGTWGKQSGSSAHMLCAGAQAWGSGTGPLACMPYWTSRGMGVAAGCPRGGGSSGYGEGRLGVGAHAPPVARPRGRLSGSAILVLWAQDVRAWKPGTDPTGYALASWCCALWKWQEGISGGVALCPREERLGLGAHPSAAARLWGKLSGSSALMPWVRVSRHGDRALTPFLACPAGHRLPWGWWQDAWEGLLSHL